MMMNSEGAGPTKPVPLDLRDATDVSKFVVTDDNGEPVVVECSFILATWPM
jgi:hypothetical protein